MHLACLVKQLSSCLNKIHNCITNDFVRKPRGIEEYLIHKATELRQLLLYTGSVVFKDIFSDECYQHCMTLNIAMKILLKTDHSKYVGYAAKLLDYFVKTFEKMYESYFVSHNVHSLLYLVDDYAKYGPLNNCSCFPFEHYMKKPDCFILTSEGEIVQIIDILSNSSVIVGKSFDNKNIYVVNNLSENSKEWHVLDIRKKKIMIFNMDVCFTGDNTVAAVPKF
ncbi:Uncharacterized protein FWK35_00024518 [Aphis craccivora]|uniref:Uncharacterized protein n=1 Tax=Aphis craccivora TaxID=307492 RepID=A0A6G0Y159_APHCR|nr:Uncharacterized protein FWK35_00024518 [Aphis craccivora]